MGPALFSSSDPRLGAVMGSTQVSIHVEASPQRCWELVSDVTNMGRWSPECYRARWLDGDRPQPGARFRGWNRRGPLRWSTSCVVDVAEAPGGFAFTVLHWGRRLTTWSYHFEPEAHGTRVVETRTSIRSFRPFTLITWLQAHGRHHNHRPAMRLTLERIRQAAEADAAAVAAVSGEPR